MDNLPLSDITLAIEIDDTYELQALYRTLHEFADSDPRMCIIRHLRIRKIERLLFGDLPELLLDFPLGPANGAHSRFN